jgi:type I restriction enzyme S subunit
MKRVRLGDVLRLRKEIVHPHDKPRGRAVFVGLEHLESGNGHRTGALDIDLERLTGRKPKFYKGDVVYDTSDRT